QRALKLEPANVGYGSALGELYISTGQPALAVPLLERFLRIEPGNINIRLTLAQAYQNLGKDLEALRTLGLRALPEPHRTMWLFLRGFSLFRSGKIGEAKGVFTTLLAYPDMRAPGRFFLANCRYVENDLEGSLPEYQAAIEEGNVPTNKALNAYYYNYGLALYRLRRFDEAGGAFRKSIELFSKDPLPPFFLARCMTEQASYAEAIS